MNTKYKRDDFGNRMKSYENVGNNLKLIPNLPVVVRLDGNRFSKLSKKVRDHIIPRWVGFKFKVYPSIINHPLNCQVIEHSQNVSKGFSDRMLTEKYWKVQINLLINNILEHIEPWSNQITSEIDCKNT